MHKSQSSRAVVAVATILALLSWLVNVTPAAAWSYRDCDTSPQYYPSKTGMVRMMRTSGQFDGMAGDQAIKQSHSCSSPDSSSSMGRSWALLTLQNSNATRFIQLGYGHADCPTTCTVDDNVLHFVYTPSSSTGGVLDDFDAILFEQPDPTDVYRFKITNDGGTWHYCIRNVTDGGSYHCKNHFYSLTFTEGEEVWWIFEVSQRNDKMGSLGSSSPARWTTMQYLPNGLSDTSSNWSVTTDDSGSCTVAGGSGDCDTELGEPTLFARHNASVSNEAASPHKSIISAYSDDTP